jgi:hypothetical protein
MLSVGIAGKRSLWKALQVVSKEDGRLNRFDFGTLLHRADDQFQSVEEERLRLAARVFARSNEPQKVEKRSGLD